MKLNHECVRDLMLYIEANVHMDSVCYAEAISLAGYNQDDIIYAADKLLEAGYINGNSYQGMHELRPSVKIESISWCGHQFLDDIRDDKVWTKAKGVLSQFSSTSLSMIGNIASQIISEMIHKQVGF